MSNIFKNISVTEIITGMESKFYPIFNRYNTTGNLNIALFNFNFNENESIENSFFIIKYMGIQNTLSPQVFLNCFLLITF